MNKNDLALNALIGFLTVLLLFLMFALGTRVFYPRIETQRSQVEMPLIGAIIQVEVMNGCGVAGVAQKFTGLLRKNGFDVVESGNFETFDVQNTLIIDRTGNLENARRLATALGVADQYIIQEISSQYFLDATIVIGSDFNRLNISD